MVRSLWVCSLVLLLGRPAVAQQLFHGARLKQIEPVLQKFVDDHQIAGAVTLIATPGNVVQITTTGLADIEAKRPMREDTIFRIASMTKLITATALMQLVEQRKIALDDPVEKYLPSFRDQKIHKQPISRPITVRDVMTHTAGVKSPDPKTTKDFTLEQLVDQIWAEGLEF